MTEEFRDLGRDKLENGQAGGGEEDPYCRKTVDYNTNLSTNVKS